MNPRLLLISLLCLLALPVAHATASSRPTTQPTPEKTRILVLTDIENEPDDAMSMVRFLTYANQFDIEGLVATTSVHQQNQTAAWRIREIVEAYEWFYYGEVGTFTVSSARSGQALEIKDSDQPNAWFTVPTSRVMPPGSGTMHIILAVTDNGKPPLTRYQRVVVTVSP